jgi:Fic family protein
MNGFPPPVIDWARLVPLIGEANRALARYDGLVASIPNRNILLSPLTTQEAVLSSRIEGTNVTMGEVLEIEAGAGGNLEPSKHEDAEEIINYRRALNSAASALQEGRPLSLHLLRETHSLLMRGVRGHEKDPGAFRTEQNWIGPAGCKVDQASFVPIPQEHLLAGLDLWSTYLQGQELDPLVQLAVIHVEFEALHPFKDGNGRLGRMLIPLFLYERGILSEPYFYMSGYLEARRDQYVESMRAVSREGAWTDWCAFFLQGVIAQASDNQRKAQLIMNLHTRMQHEIPERIRSPYAARVVDFLISWPIFSPVDFIRRTEIPYRTAHRILQTLRDGDTPVLRTLREGSGSRPAILIFPELLDIAEGMAI